MNWERAQHLGFEPAGADVDAKAFFSNDEKPVAKSKLWRPGISWAAFKPILREPLTHFVLAGALIFAASEAIEHFNSRYRVVIGPEQIGRLGATYEQQYGAAPNADQLAVLVKNFTKEEIEYRESLALGLDKGDEIVRRRLVQKFEFLQQDLQSLNPAKEEELKAYFVAHRELYAAPAKRALTQIYFSPDGAGDAEAHARAVAALDVLQANGAARAPDLGDSFPGPSDVADLDAPSAQRLFGDSDLSRAIFSAPIGQWAGPFKSGFGWHLIRVTDETPSQLPAYETVASRVAQDFDDSRQAALNETAYASIRKKYDVVGPRGGQ